MSGRTRLPSWYVTFADIERYKKVSRKGGCWHMYSSSIHPNPALYKYDWWIFWEGAPVDGGELIFNDQHLMNTAAALALCDRLMKQRIPVFVYNQRRPRSDPENPFDAGADRWKDAKWAQAYADDPDPVVDRGGMKGHK